MKQTKPAPTKAPAASKAQAEGAPTRQSRETGELSRDAALPQSLAGQPLDAATRGTMESRFGHDFSKIRIHADSRAGDRAAGLNATAFTVGDDIHFGQGRFDPLSASGRHLLAHELAHVAHRDRAGTRLPGVAPEISLAEAKAEEAARRVTAGESLGGDGFRDWGPAWSVHRQVKKISKKGTVEHTGEVGRAPGEVGVPTGEVEVRTGEEIELKGGGKIPNVISIAFTGSGPGPAADSKWLQFVWFEMVATTPKGDVHGSGSVSTTSGTKPFTTDPKAPDWTVDSASTSDPFYEAAGAHLRDKSSTTIFDKPGGASWTSQAEKLFKAEPTATRVVFTAHFATYLIQYDSAAYVVRYRASTAFTKSGGKVSAGSVGYTVGTSGQVSKLPSDLKKILHAAYTKHTHIE